jgi:lipoprotein-anchoring transpeptidase ErfK/SrfK
MEVGMEAATGAMGKANWSHGAGRALTSMFCAGGVVAALVIGTPSALADPDPGGPPPAPAVDPPAPDPPAPAVAAPLAAPPAPPAPPAAPPAPAALAAAPLAAPPAPVDPLAPQPPAAAATNVAGQNPEPFTGDPPFRPPAFNPVNGAVVGVAKPIVIVFAVPIADRALAEQAIHISSNPPVPGKFYWINDSQVRWRPLNFWPAHTVVNIDAAGTKSSFTTGDSLVATADNGTHTMTVSRNGNVVKTMPMSMGMPGHDTPNGTYYVLEKFPDIVMDSATYGVPNDSAQGYKVHVKLAVRFDNSGNFVHSAPWSVADQGKRNVSHGCINISPDNAQWFFDNFGSGDPIVVKNSVGSYTQNDGAQDWQI